MVLLTQNLSPLQTSWNMTAGKEKAHTDGQTGKKDNKNEILEQKTEFSISLFKHLFITLEARISPLLDNFHQVHEPEFMNRPIKNDARRTLKWSLDLGA